MFNTNRSITDTPTASSPATTYAITATNAGGSSTSSITIAVTRALNISQESFAAAVVAYSNPFSDAFTIQLNTNSSDLITIVIYDMLGKQIENYKVSLVQISNLQYGTAFKSGVYNVIVTQENEVKTLRLLKK